MNIQDLGALGELLAAIATIATLIYLAIQIRQNNTIAKEQAHFHMLQNQTSYYDRLATNPDYIRIAYGEHLTDPEVKQLQHQSHATSAFFKWNWEYLRAQEGIYGSTDVPTEGIRREFKNANLSEQWANQKYIFDPRFCEFMDREVVSYTDDG
jgi:hypothetical protein